MGILDTNFFQDSFWDTKLWRVVPLEIGEIDGITYLAEVRGDGSAGMKMASGIPTEFFNHELKSVDTCNDDQIVQFCSKWGILCSPYFNSYSRFIESSNEQYSSALQQYAERQDVHLFRMKAAIAILSKALNTESGGSYLAAIMHAVRVLRGQQEPESDREDYSGFRKSKLSAIRSEAARHTYNPYGYLGPDYLHDECEAVVKSLFLQTEFTQTDIRATFIDAYDINPGNIISLDEVRCVLEKLQDIAYIFPIMDAYESIDEILFEVTKLIVVEKAPIHSEALQQVATRVIAANDGVLPANSKVANFRFDKSNDPIPGLNAWMGSAIMYFEECISPIYRNAMLSKDPEILPYFTNVGYFTLQNAICIQMYFELDDNAEWVRCSYSKCNRLFKYQRYSSTYHYCQEGRKSKTKYCCRNHNIYANRQNLREAQKTAHSLAKEHAERAAIVEILHDQYPDLDAIQIERVAEKALSPNRIEI